jgi:hypothetical protein
MRNSISLCLLVAFVPLWQTVPHHSREATQGEEAQGERGRTGLHRGRHWRDYRLRSRCLGRLAQVGRFASVHFREIPLRFAEPSLPLSEPVGGRWRHYSQTQHVEDLAGFIRALNVGKVHLVSNSGGGRLVGHVALKYPELVRSASPDCILSGG